MCRIGLLRLEDWLPVVAGLALWMPQDWWRGKTRHYHSTPLLLFGRKEVLFNYFMDEAGDFNGEGGLIIYRFRF